RMDEYEGFEPKAHRRLELLGVHHEPTIAAHREHAARRIEHRGHDGRWQPGPHRCERIVEQERVRDTGAVVAGEPDFEHAVVQANDAVLRNHLPHVVHDALWRQRITALLSTI